MSLMPRSSDAWRERRPAEIVEACRAYLLMAANRAMGSDLRVKVAPSDLVQETVIVAVRDFEKFEGRSEQELLAWLTKILSYRMAEARRRFRRQRADIDREVSLDDEAHEIELSLSGHVGAPVALAIAREEEEQVHAALGQLAPEDAELFRMKHWEGLSFREIGDRIGLSEGGVRHRWGLAAQELRRRLKGQADPGELSPRIRAADELKTSEE
jgi:RNA polymerase sigma-70 factor, ECF subfamily